MDSVDATRQFFAAWSETDITARTATLQDVLSDQTEYADPMTSAPLTDLTAIADYIGNFAKMAPGSHVELADPVDIRGPYIRATVRFVMPQATQTGQYFVRAAADGRLAAVIGFAGKGPE